MPISITTSITSTNPGGYSPEEELRAAEGDAPDVGALILEEHGHLFPRLEHLGTLALESRTLPKAEFRSRLEEQLEFLRNGLLPHAQEEERSVYPAVEKLLRTLGGGTRTMSIDHRFIGEMIDELAGVSSGPVTGEGREHACRILYGLQAVLRIHFSKENEAYVPLLAKLSAADKHALHARLSPADPAAH